MARTFSRTRDHIEKDLEEQVARLAGELRALKHSLGKGGASAYREARDTGYDYYDAVRETVESLLPVARRRAGRVGRSVRHHPEIAVAGLVVAGLVAALLLRR